MFDLLRSLRRRFSRKKPPRLVRNVQAALREWFFDQDRLAQLDWSNLGENPSVEDINAVLAQLNDPHTLLLNAEQVSADEKEKNRMPSLVLSNFGGISYLRPNLEATGFADDMMALFVQHICHQDGLILDVRNKPGARIGSAMMAAAVLMPRQPTVLCTTEQTLRIGRVQVAITSKPTSLLWSRGSREVVSEIHLSDGTGPRLLTEACAKLLPRVIVLVNEKTASAAELVAAAIQAHGRGEVVGVPTFGKGRGQECVLIRDDSGKLLKLYISVGNFYTPKKHWLGDGHENRHGLQPDHVVEQAPDGKIGRPGDTQLEFAMKLLEV